MTRTSRGSAEFAAAERRVSGFVRYKKRQLLGTLLPACLRPRLVCVEWGPLPYPMRRSLPRWRYLDAERRCSREGEASCRWAQATFAAQVVARRVEMVLWQVSGAGP